MAIFTPKKKSTDRGYINFHVSLAFHKKIKTAADMYNISISVFVIQAIEFALNNMDNR